MILSACSINGSLQGLVSNYNKTKQLNSDLFRSVNHDGNCQVDTLEARIYITNGLYLRECLSKCKTDVLVYNWAPNCKSKYCISLERLQEFCDEMGFELFVVAEYYDYDVMSKLQAIKNPIYGIDVKFYKTNFTSKYTRRFYSDLLQTDISEMSVHDYLLFEKSEFRSSFTSIDELARFKERK